MADFRYVFSAPAMLRLNKSTWEVENPEEFDIHHKMIQEGIKKIQDEKVRQAFDDACARRGGFKPSTGKTY